MHFETQDFGLIFGTQSAFMIIIILWSLISDYVSICPSLPSWMITTPVPSSIFSPGWHLSTSACDRAMTSQHWHEGLDFFQLWYRRPQSLISQLTMTRDDVGPVAPVTDSTFTPQLFLTAFVDLTYIVNLSCQYNDRIMTAWLGDGCFAAVLS